MRLRYDVPGDDLSLAGRASAEVKRAMGRLGVDPFDIPRAGLAFSEADINWATPGGGGVAEADLSPERVVVTMSDSGPGIADLELAMQEGYSTAPEWIREMGFGAGMGLPNMKRNADELRIDSSPGQGTRVTIVVDFGAREGA